MRFWVIFGSCVIFLFHLARGVHYALLPDVQTLGDVPSLLSPNFNSISVTTVVEAVSFQYLDSNGTWTDAGNISADNALVLSKDTWIRIDHNAAVVVHFTKTNGSTGERQNHTGASTEKLVFLSPQTSQTPSLSEKGPACRVGKANNNTYPGIKIKDRLILSTPQMLIFHYNISDEIDSHLSNKTREVFKYILELNNNSVLCVKVVNNLDITKGKLVDNNRVICNFSHEIKFIPTKNYSGPIDFKFVGAWCYAYSDSVPEYSWLIPSKVRQNIELLFNLNNETKALKEKYHDVLRNLMKSKKPPTKSNLLNETSRLESVSTGVNKTLFGILKDQIMKAFEAAKKFEYNTEPYDEYSIVQVSNSTKICVSKYNKMTLNSKCSSCPDNQTYCDHTKQCQPKNDSCCDTWNCKNDKYYKSVYEYQQLQETFVFRCILNDTIAILSVSGLNGTLDYSCNGSWHEVGNLSTTNALVLGRSCRLRFVPISDMSHGAVLVNYTIFYGKVGAKVDASSSSRGVNDVIAIIIEFNASPTLGSLTGMGRSCNIDANNQTDILLKEYFKLSKKYLTNILTSNIPKELEGRLNPYSLQSYRRKLELANGSSLTVTVRLLNKQSQGRLKSNSTLMFDDLNNTITILRNASFEGSLQIEVQLGVKYLSSKPANFFHVSWKLRQILGHLELFDCFGPDVVNKYYDILKDLQQSNTVPNKIELLKAAERLLNQSTGVNRTLVLKAKQMIEKAFKYAERMKDEDLSPVSNKPVVIQKGHVVAYSKNKVEIKCNVVYSCPQNLSYCNHTDKCQAQKTCCRKGFSYCNLTDSCQDVSKKCCPAAHTFCQFTGKCESDGKPCCPANMTYYCNATKKCVKSQKMCCQEGFIFCNTTDMCMLKDTCCPNNFTYCNTTKKCVQNEKMCCQAGFVFCNLTNMCSLQEKCCPNNFTYCNLTSKCQPKNETCCPPKQFFCNYTSKCMSKDDCCPKDFIYCNFTRSCLHANKTCCPNKHFFCSHTNRCMKDMDREKCTPSCPSHQTFCNITNKCQIDPCCPQNLTYCNTTAKCQAKNESCCSGTGVQCSNDKGYKCSLYWQPLGEVTLDAFSKGDTVTLTNISANNGSLEISIDGATWTEVNDLKPGKGFVVDRKTKMRYRDNNWNFHGIILVHFTKDVQGKPGHRPNASSASSDRFDVFCIVIVPKTENVTFTTEDHACQIDEDDGSKGGILVHNLIKFVFSTFKNTSNIPEKWKNHISDFYVRIYEHELHRVLKALRGVKFALSKESKGSLDNNEQSSVITDLKTKLKYKPPYENFFGPFRMDITVGIVYELNGNDSAGVYKLPYCVFRNMHPLIIFNQIKDDVVKKFNKILDKVLTDKKNPTLENMVGVSANMEKTANSKDKSLIAEATKLIEKMFHYGSTCPKAERESEHRNMIEFTRDKKKYVFLPKNSNLTIKCKAVSVNDPPKLKNEGACEFPTLPYNLTEDGFGVGGVINKLAEDVEQHTLGVGVVGCAPNKLGVFQWYNATENKWINITVNNKKPFKGSVKVLLLEPGVKMRFLPHDKNKLWSKIDALKSTCALLAWDKSDNKTTGIHEFDYPQGKNSSLSEKPLVCIINRKGCGGVAGSRKKMDACGKCGGDGKSCLGCDGGLNSGAKYDDCGNCTGGATNITRNVAKLECGKCFEVKDSCGKCQNPNKKRINFKDCNGTCFGKARLNKCKVCVNGTTGNPPDAGMDACGVCGGDNSTCLDCSGVPNGGKKNDTCGKCLLPSDAQFDNSCTTLKDVQPTCHEKNESKTIQLPGAGFAKFKTASCQVVSANGTTFNLINVKIINKALMSADVPKDVPPGIYSTRCKFDSQSNYYSTETNYTIYDQNAFTVTNVSTTGIQVNNGTKDVYINGTGFPKCTRCITNVQSIWFKAKYISSKLIKCLVPNMKVPMQLRITVQFSSTSRRVHESRMFPFMVFCPEPYITRVQFLPNPQGVVLTPSQPLDNSILKNCERLIKTTSLIGSNLKCSLKNPRQLVMFGLKATTSDVIRFNTGVLKAKGCAKFTKYVASNPSGSLTFERPDNPVKPVIDVSYPSKVGPCTNVLLKVSAKSCGQKDCEFEWGVGWSSQQDKNQITANATADLQNIKNILSSLAKNKTNRIKLDKNRLLLGLQYTFTVVAKNFLGEKSENISIDIMRENKNLPNIEFASESVTVKASSTTKIGVKIKLSPCLNAVDKKTLITWQLTPYVDISTKGAILLLKPGLLKGGTTYTLEVSVAMAADLETFALKTMKINVVESALRAVIRGGKYREVSFTSQLKLDARKSSDPDNSDEQQSFSWKAYNMNEEPFVDSNNNFPTFESKDVSSFKPESKGFIANEKYIFEVTMRKGTRVASAKQTIKFVAGQPPIVFIDDIEGKVNPDQLLVIKASCKSPTNQYPLRVKWESVNEDDFTFIDLSNVKRSSQTLKKEKPCNLIIKKNLLNGGSTYKFKVTVTDKSQASSSSETTVTVNDKPKGDYFEVTTENGGTDGTAFSTNFTIDFSKKWSDDDGSLQYSVFYISNGKENLLLAWQSTNYFENIYLPEGDSNNGNKLDLYLYVKDSLGATVSVSTTVVVRPLSQITSDFIDKQETNLFNSIEGGNLDAMGSVSVLVNVIDRGNVNPADSQKVTSMKQKFAVKIMSNLKNYGLKSDPDAVMQFFKPIIAITLNGGIKIELSVRVSLATDVGGIVGVSSSERRRRRRATSPVIVPTTVSAVQDSLNIISNLINVTAYDSESMKIKSELIDAANSNGQRLCAGLVLGSPAAVVNNKLIALRSEVNSFDDGNVLVEMVCEDCPTNLANTAKVMLGTVLQSTYSSWKCSSSDELCGGACLATTQQVENLLESSLNPDTLSNIVDMRLYNPSSFALINVGVLASPVTYQLPVLNVTITKQFFECKRWNSGSSTWTSQGCVTTPTYIVDNGTKYVQCNCTELGYTAAFQSDTEPTVPPPSTASAPTTSKPVQVRRARFTFPEANYDDYASNPAKKQEFIQVVTTAIAQVMRINESQIINMALSKGSVVVHFEVSPLPSDSESSMDAAMLLLESSVEASNFSVTLSDGTVLNADPNSFSSSVGDATPAPPTKPPGPIPTEESGLSEGEIIAIACVISGIALIALVLIVVICWKKHREPSKVRSSESLGSRQQLRSEGSGMEMRNRGHVNSSASLHADA